MNTSDFSPVRGKEITCLICGNKTSSIDFIKDGLIIPSLVCIRCRLTRAGWSGKGKNVHPCVNCLLHGFDSGGNGSCSNCSLYFQLSMPLEPGEMDNTIPEKIPTDIDSGESITNGVPLYDREDDNNTHDTFDTTIFSAL